MSSYLILQDNIQLNLCNLYFLLPLTAQHRGLLDPFIQELKIPVDVDLNLMTQAQSLQELSMRLLPAVCETLNALRPDLVLVQGDTTSAFLSALAAFNAKFYVGHVEAGLRTGDRHSPYPEEINRRLIADLSDLHFAPTQKAKQNLIAEGIQPESIFVTGNTVVDTVHSFSEKKTIRKENILLVTVHRRESFGKPIRMIFQAIAEIAKRHPNLDIVFPVHPNPQVTEPAAELLADIPNIKLVKPMRYREFISTMQSSLFVLSDSGGVQEEATALGCTVILLRKETERPEAIEAGNVISVGIEPELIIKTAESLIENNALKKQTSEISHVYGQGNAGALIADICVNFLNNRE